MPRSTACASCWRPNRASQRSAPSSWREVTRSAVAPAPSSGRFAATFSPAGRRDWRRHRKPPLPAGERSAERSGG
ncbi:hypothetical protein EN766_14990, partial [Mesorhizobium sp. M2A.F.Ca.ET.046.02.1.1]